MEGWVDLPGNALVGNRTRDLDHKSDHYTTEAKKRAPAADSAHNIIAVAS